jgi:hypothetical protein
MRTLIFGAVGAFSLGDDGFSALGFFFLAIALVAVVRFAVDFFVEADVTLPFAEALVVPFAVFAVLAAVAVFVAVATTGVGVGAAGVGEGAAGVGAAGSVTGAAVGATLPAETDVVVLVACVPFVAPNRPAMNGFAMQS